MLDLLKKSAIEQHNAIKNKEVSAVELTEAALKRIDEVDEKLGSFNSLTRETAIETAKKVDEKIAKGEELPLLAGVPLALKDNMNLIGSKTIETERLILKPQTMQEQKRLCSQRIMSDICSQATM